MENGPATALSGKVFEDPLAYLPCSAIREYGRGQTIYDQGQPWTSVYLVIKGRVKVFRLAANGSPVLMDIYQRDEFFGESAFLEPSQRGTETSIALENTKLMAWTAGELEDLAARRPQLAIALLQLFVQRSMYLEERIESLSVDPIVRRLARALLRFSERMGRQTDDGWVEITDFTHELLGQYVGTSREIVTQYMNQFRRQGSLLYSRKSILLRPEMVREWLKTESLVA